MEPQEQMTRRRRHPDSHRGRQNRLAPAASVARAPPKLLTVVNY